MPVHRYRNVIDQACRSDNERQCDANPESDLDNDDIDTGLECAPERAPAWRRRRYCCLLENLIGSTELRQSMILPADPSKTTTTSTSGSETQRQSARMRPRDDQSTSESVMAF